MTGKNYIDEGDRVVVTDRIAVKEHGRAAVPSAVGMHGIVLSNDGWGLCRVKLDNERGVISAWNGIDLTLEEDDG